MMTKRKSLSMRTNSKRVWPQSSHLAISTPTTWLKPGTPVVLVDVYACKQVFLPLPQDLRAHKVLPTQATTQATGQLPGSTPSPLKAQSQTGQTYVNVCIWLPRQLMVQSCRQGAPLGSTKGYEISNSSSCLELFGASRLLTPR